MGGWVYPSSAFNMVCTPNYDEPFRQEDRHRKHRYNNPADPLTAEFKALDSLPAGPEKSRMQIDILLKRTRDTLIVPSLHLAADGPENLLAMDGLCLICQILHIKQAQKSGRSKANQTLGPSASKVRCKFDVQGGKSKKKRVVLTKSDFHFNGNLTQNRKVLRFLSYVPRGSSTVGCTF